MLSPAVENFLKAVYELSLQSDDAWVSHTALAGELKISAAAITNMVKKLSAVKKPLVEYKPYAGTSLSAGGRLVALEVLRHHRLIELYLCEALNVPWDEVHEEAEKLEHHISESLEARMAEVLGDPRFDPHGAPIPTKEGEVFYRQSCGLNEMDVGTTVEIVEVYDRDSELLRYLGARGLYPNVVLKILKREPFENSLEVELKGKKVHIGENATRYIRVAEIEEITC